MNRENHMLDLTPRASLAVGEHDHPSGGTILHPTDYSAGSRQAFELACRIARDRGSRLVVMHVAEPVRISSFGMAPVPPLPKGYRGGSESRLRMLQPEDSNIRVEHRLEEGDVAAAILRIARETQCDLIVMASSERTWLGRLLYGSVTNEVEHKASCSVLRVDTHPLEAAG
jgi:nucleotide-binding universal stress UspA family protein